MFNDQRLSGILESEKDKWDERIKKIGEFNHDIKIAESHLLKLGIPDYQYKNLFWSRKSKKILWIKNNEKKLPLSSTKIEIREEAKEYFTDFFMECLQQKLKGNNNE